MSSFSLLQELRAQCQEFATTLLGHARTSVELQTLLNHQATKHRAADEGWEPGEKQSLERLKLAIKYKQKRVGSLNILAFINCLYGRSINYAIIFW